MRQLMFKRADDLQLAPEKSPKYDKKNKPDGEGN